MDNKASKKTVIGNFQYPTADGQRWAHINLIFSDNFPLNKMSMLKRFVWFIWGRIFTYIERGFYLIPTGKFLMLAIQLRQTTKKESIERIITDIKKIYIDTKEANYIKTIEIEWDTNDHENGEGYLNVMNAVMEFNLLYEDHSALHLLHTIVNSMLMAPDKEKKLYKILEKTYG